MLSVWMQRYTRMMVSIFVTIDDIATVRTEQVQRLVREVASLILDGALLEVCLDVNQRSGGDEGHRRRGNEPTIQYAYTGI